ncbi:alpha/beta hydrolase [Peptostreptococcus equinus]|uniref:Alpha/beta hydrolase n=1 Tax=Peptostreptococcus equinus TaxID=3003601 RepID=A0ABY7JMV6_9FIRM|nr:alpha/beta hydrolase [Peptostreptococcus sp. CBA3647]WAW14698.1 alpha/beta hydrolase [Peptostreptococcus sp. CBA3647]
MFLKYLLIIVFTAVMISIFIIFYISHQVSYKLNNPKRLALMSNPKDMLGLDYENIQFMSQGNQIYGWYIPAHNPTFTLVYSHGYMENRESPTFSAYDFFVWMNSIGANILTFDYSGQGRSQGGNTTSGKREKEDLLEAIAFAKKKSNCPIIVHGISMGASTAILAASNNKDIIGLVCDSPFSNLKNYLENNLNVWTKLPKIPFNYLVLKFMEKKSRIDPKDISPLDEICKVVCPILLIHGKSDRVIPYGESVKLRDKSVATTELIIFDNKGHCKSYKNFKKEYIVKYRDFLRLIDKNLIK